MASDFDIRKDSRGEYYWTLQAENNKTLAKSSESYTSRSGCLHGIALVKKIAPSAPVWDCTGAGPVRVDPKDIV
jgi:uncharacterized protein YegP (UPF0339 family)